MIEHMHIQRRLALLPDEDLMHLLQAVSTQQRAADRPASRKETVAVISRELEARGIVGPPWWSRPTLEIS